MFDSVIYQGREYQTKDLKCMMEVYTITEDGKLVSDTYHMEDVPLDQRPFPDMPFLGSVKQVVDIKDVDQHYHGHLHFYAVDLDGKWIDYFAKFTDGKLVEIKREERDLDD